MKEFGVFFSGLVQDLAGLRESAVQGLTALQTEHDKLANQIRQAQERHEMVRADLHQEHGDGFISVVVLMLLVFHCEQWSQLKRP